MLEETWDLRGNPAINVFRCNTKLKNFRRRIRDDEWWAESINRALKDTFLRKVKQQPKLYDRFEALRYEFDGRHGEPSWEVWSERTRFIGDLRRLLAQICLRSLRPDLVILDEFQRFRTLLHADSEESELARILFEYVDSRRAELGARVLLLSATPYRMYTTAAETRRNGENHHEDFVSTAGFLLRDESEKRELAADLRTFRSELYRLGEESLPRLREARARIERQLTRVMCRTERLASTPDRMGMLKHRECGPMVMEADEVQGYLGMQGIAEALGYGSIVEFWKSAPYLLNFMDTYQLKKRFLTEVDAPRTDPAIIDAAIEARPELLSWKPIFRYRPLPLRNARLRWIVGDVVDRGAWRILWMPPAAPYTTLEGPFADPKLRGFTKRLIFSAWRVVPKSIACAVSYEAERRMMKHTGPDAKNTEKDRKKVSNSLPIAFSENRLTGMPVLALMYPCLSLARLVDPLDLLQSPASVEDAITRFSEVLGPHVEALTKGHGGPEDQRWYWAAPLLLDAAHDEKATRDFLEHEDTPHLWFDLAELGRKKAAMGIRRWIEHCEMARRMLDEKDELGGPPADLTRVLAMLALAGPGIVSLRSLSRVCAGARGVADRVFRIQAARLGYRLRNLFNLPEVVSLIRAPDRKTPYWQRVLKYGAQGCAQAVMDEYVHFAGSTPAADRDSPERRAEKVADEIARALAVRTASMSLHEISARATGVSYRKRQMRSHFALRFGKERSETDEDVDRAEDVRAAFNSPFWPFVLATTSVGQEGLDFHGYCHAVVHWNLPSNPVDLEQREGRVHRYKGHAVRKNVAAAAVKGLNGGGMSLGSHADPWERFFELASDGHKDRASDIVPFWVFEGPDGEGAVIERYVPTLPLSREARQIERLHQALAIYRMVFGQPRQEDLLRYLVESHGVESIEDWLDELAIDLTPASAAR